MRRGSRLRVPNIAVCALALVLLVGACARDTPPVAVRPESQSAAPAAATDEVAPTNAAPTAGAPEDAATATPLPGRSSAEVSATPPSTPEPRSGSSGATAVPAAGGSSRPEPTVAPTARSAPPTPTPALVDPTPTSRPTPTAAPVVVGPNPTPTNVAVPTATATPRPDVAEGVVVTCSVSPQDQVKVGDPVQFTASTNRTDLLAINFTFDHGDGTSATGPVAAALAE